jgi:hypothetical protein
VQKSKGAQMKHLVLLIVAVIGLSQAHADGPGVFQPIPFQPVDNYAPDYPLDGRYVRGYEPRQLSQDDLIALHAYDTSRGNCDFRVNPHSYECTRMAFEGATKFPLYEMDWWGILQGEWFTVTYVNSSTENVGSHFAMAKNRRDGLQAMGVYNQQTKSGVGPMWIEGGDMVFSNWQGYTIRATGAQIVDRYTVRLVMEEGSSVHYFTCRDFNRNNNHHLLCRWDVWEPQSGTVHHGYFGFLTAQVWNGFINSNKVRN